MQQDDPNKVLTVITADMEIAASRLLWAYQGLLRLGLNRPQADTLIRIGVELMGIAMRDRAQLLEP